MHQRAKMALSDDEEQRGGDDRPHWLSDSAISNDEIVNPVEESASLSGDASLRDGLSAGAASWLDPIQHLAGISAHVLAFAAAVLVFLWAFTLGGFSWKQGESKIVFNWHPVCMVIAFVFMTVSALSFRMKWRHNNRNVTKLLHVIEWITAALCMAVGLVAVFRSHNDPISGYIANLYSLHSWIGIAVLLLYTLQFFVGLFTFGMDIAKCSPSAKYNIMMIHKFMGPFIYSAVAATILLGIQEKEGFIGCYYEVTEPDLFPPAHLSEIPHACKLSHSLGLVVLTTALCTAFAVHDFKVVGSGRRTD